MMSINFSHSASSTWPAVSGSCPNMYFKTVCWDVNVSWKIYNWTPLSQELDDVWWIEQSEWVFQVLPPGGITGMNERVGVRKDERNTEKIGKPLILRELSNATLQSWAWLLATVLGQLELAIDATKEAQEKNLTCEETEGFGDIHSWCYCLCTGGRMW